MRHLSASEFIDLADGTLARARAAHADRCEVCRAQSAVVREALMLAAASPEVPEPSPFFWDRLSARVRAAIDDTPPRSAFAGRFAAWQPAVAALAVLLVIVSAVFTTRQAASRVSRSPADASSVAQSDHAIDPMPYVEHAAEWAVLTAAASDLQLDDVRDAGMDVPSAAVDRAVTQLTRDELSELGRLLQSELKGSAN